MPVEKTIRYLQRVISITCVTTLMLTSMANLAQPTEIPFNEIIINAPSDPNDPRYRYSYELLQKVLDVTESEYGSESICLSEVSMSRERVLRELIKGQFLQVMAEAQKPDWEENLIRVPIPIRKGLQGFRLFLVTQNNRDILKDVDSLAKLARIRTGVGSDWSIRKPLEQAGLKVIPSPSYKGAFGMLVKGRFDTFNRGINEAYEEVDAFKLEFPELWVDEHLLMHIPINTFYYVSPLFPKIAQRIETGLMILIENGDFDTFFMQNYCGEILTAHLDRRKVISIARPEQYYQNLHPNLPEQFILHPDTQLHQQCEQFQTQKSPQ